MLCLELFLKFEYCIRGYVCLFIYGGILVFFKGGIFFFGIFVCGVWVIFRFFIFFGFVVVNFRF